MFKTKFFGILKLEKTNAADIMDLMKKFFLAKGVNVEKILFSVLDGTNAMSGRKNCLKRRIRIESPHNIYLICHNHRLALCLPHLMTNKEFAPLLPTYRNCLLVSRKHSDTLGKNVPYLKVFRKFTVKSCWRFLKQQHQDGWHMVRLVNAC